MKDIKSIPAGVREFQANGKRYIIMDKITVLRYKEYEKLVPRLTFGLDFNEMYKNLEKMYAALNKQQFANSAVICHNMMNGISNVNDPNRVHPAMMMAALVINREDENPGSYDETLMMDKINDWTVEGFDMMSFFELSLNSIQGFRETLVKYTQAQAELVLKNQQN